jgi:hypothetical protein
MQPHLSYLALPAACERLCRHALVTVQWKGLYELSREGTSHASIPCSCSPGDVTWDGTERCHIEHGPGLTTQRRKI